MRDQHVVVRRRAEHEHREPVQDPHGEHGPVEVVAREQDRQRVVRHPVRARDVEVGWARRVGASRAQLAPDVPGGIGVASTRTFLAASPPARKGAPSRSRAIADRVAIELPAGRGLGRRPKSRAQGAAAGGPGYPLRKPLEWCSALFEC